MSEFCTRCGAPLDEGDEFCGKCGARRGAPADSAPESPIALTATRRGASSSKPVKVLPIIMGILLPLGLGLFFLFSGIGDCGSTEGTLEVTGTVPERNFSFKPTGCASMQPYGRFGANLHGDGPNDGAVYVSMDPINGPSVEVEIPGSCRNADGTDCTIFSVPRASCTVFEANVDPTNTTVNDVRLVEGRMNVDCVLDDGTHVKGTITFSGC